MSCADQGTCRLSGLCVLSYGINCVMSCQQRCSKCLPRNQLVAGLHFDSEIQSYIDCLHQSRVSTLAVPLRCHFQHVAHWCMHLPHNQCKVVGVLLFSVAQQTLCCSLVSCLRRGAVIHFDQGYGTSGLLSNLLSLLCLTKAVLSVAALHSAAVQYGVCVCVWHSNSSLIDVVAATSLVWRPLCAHGSAGCAGVAGSAGSGKSDSNEDASCC